jgi:chromosome segregation ATPase
MDHHCTKTANDKLMFFVNGKRVTRTKYETDYPEFKESDCVRTEHRLARFRELKRAVYSNQDGAADERVRSCNTQLAQCNEQVRQLQQQLADFNKQCDSEKSALQKFLDDCNSGLIKYKSDNKALQQLREKLERDGSAIKSGRDKLRDSLNEAIQRQKLLESELKDAKTQVTTIGRQNAELISNRSVLQTTVAELTREIQSYRQQINNGEGDRGIVDDEQMADYVYLINRLQSAEAERDSARAQLQSLNDQLTANNAELATLRTENAGQAQSIGDITRQLSEKDDERAQLQSLNGQLTAERERLRTENAGQLESIENITKQLGETEDTIKGLISERDSVRQELITVNSEIESLRSSQGDSDEIRSQLQRMKTERNDLQAKFDELTESCQNETVAKNQLIKQLEEATSKNDQCRTELDGVNTNLAQQTESVERIRKELKEATTESSQAKSKLFTVKKEKELIQKQLRENTSERDVLSGTISDLQSELLKSKNDHSQTLSELDSGKNNKSQLEGAAELSKLNAKFSECEETRKQLLEAIDRFEASQKKWEAEKRELEEELDNRTSNHNTIMQEKDSQSSGASAQLVQKTTEYNAALEKLQLEVNKMTIKLEESTQICTSKLAALKSSYETKIAELSKELNQTKSNLKNSEANNRQVQSELQSSRRVADECKISKKQIEDNYEEKLSNCEQRATECNEKLTTLQMTLADFRQQVEQERAELLDGNKRAETLKQAEFDRLRTSLEQAVDKQTSLNSELSNANSILLREKTEIQQQLQVLTAEMVELRKNLSDGEGDRNELRTQLKALEAERNSLLTELQSIKKELENVKSTGNAENERLRNELRQITGQFEECNAERQTLRKTIEEFNASRTSWDSERQEMTEQIRNYLENVSRLEANVSDITNKLAQLQSSCDSRIATLTTERDQCISDKQGLQEQYDALNQKFSEHEQVITELRRIDGQKALQLTELTNNSRETAEELIKRQQRIDELTASLNRPIDSRIDDILREISTEKNIADVLRRTLTKQLTDFNNFYKGRGEVRSSPEQEAQPIFGRLPSLKDEEKFYDAQTPEQRVIEEAQQVEQQKLKEDQEKAIKNLEKVKEQEEKSRLEQEAKLKKAEAEQRKREEEEQRKREEEEQLEKQRKQRKSQIASDFRNLKRYKEFFDVGKKDIDAGKQLAVKKRNQLKTEKAILDTTLKTEEAKSVNKAYTETQKKNKIADARKNVTDKQNEILDLQKAIDIYDAYKKEGFSFQSKKRTKKTTRKRVVKPKKTKRTKKTTRRR